MTTMAGIIQNPLPPPVAGMKRANPTDDTQQRPASAVKKQKIIQHHRIQHKQAWATDPTMITQDKAFFQSQLLRALSLNLSAVGFAGARPAALESFRAAVEEYMLHFLAIVKGSMDHCRRAQPLPQDFALALSRFGLTSSDLEPHAHFAVAPEITQPTIPPPPPAEPPAPDLEGLLGPALSGRQETAARRYIPAHFPTLPSKHTWQATPVYPSRETDPRKIRERATQEGILAEQALRKLMAASKGGGKKTAAATTAAGSRNRPQDPAKVRWQKIWDETMQFVAEEDRRSTAMFARREDARLGLDVDFMEDVDGPALEEPDADVVEGGMLVNYERRYWRKAVQSATWGS